LYSPPKLTSKPEYVKSGPGQKLAEGEVLEVVAKKLDIKHYTL